MSRKWSLKSLAFRPEPGELPRRKKLFSRVQIVAIAAGLIDVALTGACLEGGGAVPPSLESGENSGADTSLTPSGSSGQTNASDSLASATSTASGIDDETIGDCGELLCPPGDPAACGPGMKCTPFACLWGTPRLDSTRCAPLRGQKQAGEPCTRDLQVVGDECDAGLFCLASNVETGEGAGTCIQLCDLRKAPEHRCDFSGEPRDHCFAFNGAVTPYCLPTCHPLRQECEAGESCYFAIDSFFCATPRASELGDGSSGAPCNFENACQTGLACIARHLLSDCETLVQGSIDGCCAAYCDLQDPECADGLSCNRLPVQDGEFADVGFCGNSQ
jgi:hypothetical protein